MNFFFNFLNKKNFEKSEFQIKYKKNFKSAFRKLIAFLINYKNKV